MPDVSARLYVVVVLYQMKAEDSAALRTLDDRLREKPSLREQLSLLIVDNSSTPQQVPAWMLASEYVSAPSNPGLATAYNTALARAAEAGCTWLLLLDQDTALTLEFLDEAFAALSDPELQPEVAVLVPRLVQGERTHSPACLPRLSHKPVTENPGVLTQEITAFSSGSVWRVAAVAAQGGFPQAYPLEFLDHASFARAQRSGGRVHLLRARLEHRLSTQRLGEEMSLERYRSMLLAERRFYGEHGTFGERVFYHLRRAKQALAQVFKVPDKQFALLSAQAALGLLGPVPARTQLETRRPS